CLRSSSPSNLQNLTWNPWINSRVQVLTLRPADWKCTELNRLQHVRVSFQKQGIMRLLHSRISRLEKGLVELSASNRPELSQQDGFVHAGVMATLADSAAGYATLSLLP